MGGIGVLVAMPRYIVGDCNDGGIGLTSMSRLAVSGSIRGMPARHSEGYRDVNRRSALIGSGRVSSIRLRGAPSHSSLTSLIISRIPGFP